MKRLLPFLLSLCFIIMILPMTASSVNATVKDDGGTWLWPVDATKKAVSGRFAPSDDPGHKAIDISGEYGKTIRATRAGTVCYVQKDASMALGYYVIVKHTGAADGNTYYSHYAHLSSISVKNGQKVKIGETLGVMGDTGESYGVHLHFQITKNTSQHYGRTYPNVSLAKSPVVNTNVDSISYIMNPNWAYTLTISNNEDTGKPYLQWDKRTNAVKYKVYRKTSSSGYSCITTTSNRFYTDTSAVAGTYYKYYIKAINSNGAKLQSTYEESRTCDLMKPAITLSCRASDGKPVIKWDKVAKASYYEVYRSTSKNGTYTRLGTSNTLNFTNTSAVAGKSYYYKVRAIYSANSGANSAYSKPDWRVCDLVQPVIKTGCRASDGKPTVSWDKVEKADRYYVYRATSKNGNYTKMYSTKGTSYVNTSAVAGKSYYYKVKAIYDANSSANSAYSKMDWRVCDLARPVVKASSRSSDGKPMLSWNKIDKADRYYVYRSTSKNGSYTKMYSTKATSYVNTSAVAGKTYYYKVMAICDANSSANSAYSEVVSKKYTYPNEANKTRSNTVMKAEGLWSALDVYGKDVFKIKYNTKTKEIYSCTESQEAENLGTHICEPAGIVKTKSTSTKWYYTSTWYLNFNILPDAMIALAEEVTPELAALSDLGRIAEITTKYEVTGDGKLTVTSKKLKFMVPSNLEQVALDVVELLLGL